MTRTIRRLVSILALLALTGVGSATIAGADGSRTVVAPGLSTTGGTVTAPDGSDARTFSSTESASMMQPLLAAMYYSQPQFVDPPRHHHPLRHHVLLRLHQR